MGATVQRKVETLVLVSQVFSGERSIGYKETH